MTTQGMDLTGVIQALDKGVKTYEMYRDAVAVARTLQAEIERASHVKAQAVAAQKALDAAQKAYAALLPAHADRVKALEAKYTAILGELQAKVHRAQDQYRRQDEEHAAIMAARQDEIAVLVAQRETAQVETERAIALLRSRKAQAEEELAAAKERVAKA